MDAAIAKIYPFFNSLKGKKKGGRATTHNLLFAHPNAAKPIAHNHTTKLI